MELVSRLLKGQSTLVLATSAEDGSACAAPLFYLAGDDIQLYWFSSSSSAHSRNLKRDSRAAVAIYQDTDDWQKIRGVQMRGTASMVTNRRERASMGMIYTDRFHLGTIFRTAIARSSLYHFKPAWIRYIDNSRGFGFKFEL